MPDKNVILAEVEKLERDIVETLKNFVSINSVNPRAGGPGEVEVAEYLEGVMRAMAFDEIKKYDAPDPEVRHGYRPNLVGLYKGTAPERTIWFITHMDKVPAGDLSLWSQEDPYLAIEKDGRIYGRGAEDNGSSLVATLFGVKALMNLGIKPRNNIAICFVSDEEYGSDYGISYLIKENVFGKNDWFIVPDAGDEKGSFIEVAEKSIVWLKVSTEGKQAHASMPNLAKNASRAAMNYAVALDNMIHSKYTEEDNLFTPSYTTFEPTMKRGNGENINTIPGTDEMYFDARILPMHSVKQILKDANDLAREYEKNFDVTIKLETVQMEEAPEPTPADHPLTLSLKNAVQELRNIEPVIGGIGGGTCAALLRRLGLPAVVWATLEEWAHQPDENVKIEFVVDDAKVYAYLMSTL